jgi:hypothetical protein
MVAGLLVVVPMASCSGRAVILPNPPNAHVTVDGRPMHGNAFKYGRWVGNSYTIEVSAPNYETRRERADVELGHRAGAIALFCVATIIGIPFLPVVFWNGEMDDRIYIPLLTKVHSTMSEVER